MENSTAAVPQPLDGAALRAALAAPAGPYARIETVGSTGSTNDDVAAAAGADPGAWPDLCVLAADHQSAGRGRMDREWSSPPRTSVSVSVLLRPALDGGGPLPADAYGWLSVVSSVAMAEAIEEETGVPARLKWPNDILASGRKLCGVLAQLVPAGPVPAVVVGTGVNVALDAGHLPVATATSLLLEGVREPDNTRLVAAYLARLAELYRGFVGDGGDPRRGLLERASSRMATLGTRVRAELPGGASVEGLAEALEADGSLSVRTDDGGVHPVRAGDVVHLRRADGGYA